MSEYMQYVIGKIREYKCLDGFKDLKCLDIKNTAGKTVAKLRPITVGSDLDKPEWVHLLTEWRRENPLLSENEFVPTEDRTKRWLNKTIIDSNDKILFMILDMSGNAIGHIGLSNFDYDNRKAVIYSVLRGVQGVIAGVMELSLRSLINWSKSELGIEKFELSTQKINERAIRLYKKVGFEIVETIPLKKVLLADEVQWIPDVCGSTNAEKIRIRMVYMQNEKITRA